MFSQNTRDVLVGRVSVSINILVVSADRKAVRGVGDAATAGHGGETDDDRSLRRGVYYLV